MPFYRRLGGRLRNKELDGNAFSDHMHDIGRAYRHRAIELIRICQRFSAVSEQSFSQDRALTRALEKCDVAIQFAIKSAKKANQETDDHFQIATRTLKDYELDFHKRTTVEAAMEKATQKDMDNKHKRRDSPNDDKLINVEFHIMSSLPCKDPIIVKQKLSNRSGLLVLTEILWNFSHFPEEKRLRLAQNPHFYRDLPDSPTAYKGTFSRQPTDIYEGTIYVLTNNLVPESGDSRRVFFEVGGQKRAFDNVWDTNNTLIFKDVTGRLEGETLVESSIPAGTISYHMIRMRPSPAQTNAPKHTRDWKVPIRELLGEQFSHTDVLIGGHDEMHD